MTLFSNLTNDGLEEAQDRLGGGFQALETDTYVATIKMAYADQAPSGARNVTFLFDINGTEFRETIYITNKAGQNWFPNKQDNTKKVPLPGFTTVDDICLVATGSPLAEQPTEDKMVKIWDREARQELPKAKPVLTELLGKTVGLGIVKQTVDVTEKQGDAYVPTGKTRDENTIDKVFDVDTRLTVVEAKNGLEKGVFIESWTEKNKGQTRDRTAKDSAKNGRPGASNNNTPPQAGAKPAGKSLFGKSAA